VAGLAHDDDAALATALGHERPRRGFAGRHNLAGAEAPPPRRVASRGQSFRHLARIAGLSRRAARALVPMPSSPRRLQACRRAYRGHDALA
jgi:hypothetical protein